MASDVQKEYGHSPIAHPILEALALAHFSPAQFKVLFVVIRESYGWSRRDAQVSRADFVRRTGTDVRHVQRALKELVAEGVLQVVRPASFAQPAMYRLEKDATRWGRFSREEADSPPQGENATTPPDNFAPPNGTQPPEKTIASSRVKQVKAKKTSSSTKKKRRTALSEDWVPNEKHRKRAAELGVDVELEAEKMRNWATANGKRMIDWDAQFRNWLLNATPQTRNGQASSPLVGAVLELFRNGGAMLTTADTRPLAYIELEANHPDAWARAGPQFQQIYFPALYDVREKPYELRREIEQQLESIRTRA